MNTIELNTTPNGEIDQSQIKHLRQSLQTLPVINIQFNGQEIGDKASHFDAIPGTYRTISNALISQWDKAPSPESLQEILDASALVDAKTAGISQPYIFAKMIENMNAHFAESQDLKPTNKNILTGFFSCVDRICKPSQEKINQATRDAIIEGVKSGKTEEQVIQEVQSILDETDPKKIPTTTKTRAQVLGVILRTFEHRVSRASISDKKLADWVEQTFQKEYDKVGGASAQVGDYLYSIGEKNCTVYTETNSPDQANAYKHPVKFLRLSENGLEVHQITDKESTRSSDATKINYPIEIPPKTEITFNGKLIKSKDIADRVILTTEYFDTSGDIINVFPLFNCSNSELEQIASQYEYFIINGIQYLQRYSPELYQQIAQKIAEQLSILKLLGVKTHYEISGNTTGKLEYLDDVVKGRISSAGCGHEELYDIVSTLQEMGKISKDTKIYQGSDGQSIYQNALTLAKYLQLDRLYIHGHSIDITIRKGITQNEQLVTERKAMYHAKQRVVEWLTGQESTEKTPLDKKLSSQLKRKGFEELIKLGRQITANLNLDAKSKAKILKELYSKGYYRQPEEEYSLIAIPVKWIYGDKIKGTTSVGDIGSYTNFVQSGL